MLDRRQILLGLSAVMGGSLLPASVRALEGSLDTASENNPKVLTEAQLDTVAAIAEIIIPATDTPGAKGAGVPAWVDQACANWLLQEETTAFVAALEDFLKAHPDFVASPADAQLVIVEQLDARLDDLPADGYFYRQLKELVLIGYYTSEVGATEELAFDGVPGGYRQIKLSDDTKVWAT